MPPAGAAALLRPFSQLDLGSSLAALRLSAGGVSDAIAYWTLETSPVFLGKFVLLRLTLRVAVLCLKCEGESIINWEGRAMEILVVAAVAFIWLMDRFDSRAEFSDAVRR
jgi:hypothetical protein